MKRILVTGAAGYIGSDVLVRLGAHAVTAIDRRLVAWRVAPGHPIVGHVATVAEFLGRAPGPPDFDVVVHLAFPRLDACNAAAVAEAEVDVGLLVGRYGPCVVFASSCAVYGATPAGRLSTEDDDPAPDSDYARAKLAAERIVLAAGGVVLRLATVCGLAQTRGAMRWDTIVNAACASAAAGKPIEVRGPGARRALVHIRDAANAIARAALAPRPGVYNVVGENWRKADIFREAGCRVRTVETGDARDYAADGRRFERVYRCKVRRPIVEAIDDMRRSLGVGRSVA